MTRRNRRSAWTTTTRVLRSRVARVLAATVAVVLTALGAPGLASPAMAVGSVNPANNPDLVTSCGLDVVLVLDGSSSIADAGAVNDVRTSARTFVSAFKDTNTRIGIVRFGSKATTSLGLTPVTSQSAGTGGEHENAIASYTAPPIGSNTQYTNWQDAAIHAKAVLDNATPRAVAKLVVFVTDGAPTAYNSGPNGSSFTWNNSTNPTNSSLDPAITEVNKIKNANYGTAQAPIRAHMLGVGVGDAFQSGNGLADRLESLRKITQSPTPKVFPDTAFDAATTDLIMQKNFSGLEDDLRMVASALCDGSLTITKKVSDQNNPNQYQTAGAGWEFSTTVAPAGGWVQPATGGNATRSATTEASGAVGFQWSGAAGWTKTATVTETPKQDYTLDKVECSTNGGSPQDRPITDGTFSVEVGAGKTVACTVYNKFTGPGSTDVGITKTVSDPTVVVGQQVTWSVTVVNNGPKTTANDVVVTDTLPSGVTYVPGSANVPADTTFDPATKTWTIPTLQQGAQNAKTLTFKTTVDAAGPHTNVAAVTDLREHDTDPSNDEDDATVTGILANVKIEKTADVETQVVGKNVVWTVKVTNTGAAPATNVVVSDAFPSGLTIVSDDPSQGTFDQAGKVWTVGTLAAGGGSATLTLTTKATTTGEKLNKVTVTTDTPETTTDDNTAEDSVLITAPDLVVTKVADVEQVGHGGTVVWTVRVENTGDATAEGVTVTDEIPPGLQVVSTEPEGVLVDGVWTVGDLPAGQHRELRITTTANAVGEIVNRACAETTSEEPDVSDNCGEDTVEVLPTDVSITKTADLDEVIIDGTVFWTITVTNNSTTTDAKNVVVIDTLPAGLELVEAVPSQGDYDWATSSWTVGDLAKGGGYATLVLETRVPGVEGLLTNVVDVTTDTPESDYDNNSDDHTVKVVAADLAVTKSADAETVVLGDQVVWTVTVKNVGTATATDVVVDDVLPDGLELVSTTPAGALVDGRWSVGTLAPDAEATLQIVTTVTETGTLTNQACASTPVPERADGAPSCAEDSVTVTVADVKVTKSADADSVVLGDSVEWTITVTNDGDADAHDVVVTDVLPAGLELVSTTPAGALVDNRWTVGTLAAKSSTTLKLVTKTTQTGSVTNEACVETSTPDTSAEDDCAEDSVTVTVADVKVTKSADADSVVLGDSVEWTITVTNDGDADAHDVVVTDVLPAGLELVSTTPAGALVDNRWTVGTLAAKSSTTLKLVTRTTQTGEITNEACVETDRSDAVCDSDSVDVTVADVRITKSADADSVVLGDSVEWTITVTNDGDADAHDVVVTDVLPAGLELVSTTPAGALVDNRWTVGTLAAKSSTTLKLVTKTTQTGSVTNEACVETSTPDTSDADDCAEDTVEVTAPDLGVVKTVSDDVVGHGDEVEWTITVTNDGDADAHDVVLTDLLPAGLELVSTVPADALVEGTWAVGTVEKGDSRTLTVRTKVVAVGDVTNTACVATSTPEPDRSDNCGEDTVTGVPTNVSITKQADVEQTLLGSTVVWTVTVTNTSDADAQDVVVEDVLPAGLTFVDDSATQGTFDAGSGVWEVGTLPRQGGSATLTLTTTADVTGTLRNEADVTTSTPESDLTDNHAEDDVVVRAADVVVEKQASSEVGYVGGDVSWTITVRNLGDAPAEGVVVEDTVPEGLVLEAADQPSQGTFDLGTAVWEVGTLQPDGTATLTLHTGVEKAGPLTNSVCVDTRTVETDVENNCDDDTTTGEQAPPLAIEKVNLPEGEVEPGDTVSYTLRVSVPATAPLPHDAVVVSDHVPGHDPARPLSGSTTYVDGSAACVGDLHPAGGTCDVSLTTDGDGTVTQVVWALGRMVPGQSLDLTFQVVVGDQSDAPAAALADGVVEILNAGQVFSAYSPVVDSNEVVNTVTVDVEGTDEPAPAQPPAEPEVVQVDPPGRLAFTGLELVRMLSLGLMLVLLGIATRRVARQR